MKPTLEGPHVIAERYEVIGLVGVGGMGAVYKVRDRMLDEIVALKMLRPELAHAPVMLERFRREVKLARRVTHLNVARVFDLQEAGHERFLTMELVEGETLEAMLVRKKRLDLERVIELVQPICAGLAAAHAVGVVHRDLKPDNVLLAKDGRVVITDFGIARLEAPHPLRTSEMPVGTPAYMAPEQVQGDEDIDFRADLYALGVMLFEMLTGRLPWEATSVYALAAMRLTQDPPSASDFATLPEPVSLLVQRCMARTPEDRPGSAQEVATRFASFTLPALPGSIVPPAVPSAPVSAPMGGTKTVAVLPFRNAGAAEDDYIAEGITDDLIDSLSMTPGLRVRPRGIVAQAASAMHDAREVGRAVAVQVVVTGTVTPSEDGLRVTARALSVEDGFQLWAQRFEGRRADVLRMADDTARAVAAALTVRKPTRTMLTDAQAIDLYLRGRHEYLKFWSVANDRAVKLLADAYAIAPDHPLIMAAYASALARQFGLSEVAGRQELARSVAERVVQVAPELPEGHVALATVRLHAASSEAATNAVARALELAPSHPDALELRARLLSEAGEHALGIEIAQRAMLLEPRMASLRYNVIARAMGLRREWEEVEREMVGVPEDAELASLYWLVLARLTLWKRDVEQAERIATAVRQLPQFGSQGLVLSACVIMTSKTLRPTERAFLQARIDAPHATQRMRTFWHQITAELLAYAGELDAAFAEIEAADGLGLFDRAWIEGCALLDPLRERPAFTALAERVAARAKRVAAPLA